MILQDKWWGECEAGGGADNVVKAPPTFGGYFRYLFRSFCTLCAPRRAFSSHVGHSGRCFFAFCLQLLFSRYFFAFWTPQGPSRTPKNHENHCTIIKNQGFTKFKKVRSRDRFWCPWGSLWVPFWSLLGSLGLPLAPFGPPKRSQSRKKSKKVRS